MAAMKEILLSKEFVMIILFVLLYILAKTTKERDKASMESARNIIIYKEQHAYRAEEQAMRADLDRAKKGCLMGWIGSVK